MYHGEVEDKNLTYDIDNKDPTSSAPRVLPRPARSNCVILVACEEELDIVCFGTALSYLRSR